MSLVIGILMRRFEFPHLYTGRILVDNRVLAALCITRILWCWIIRVKRRTKLMPPSIITLQQTRRIVYKWIMFGNQHCIYNVLRLSVLPSPQLKICTNKHYFQLLVCKLQQLCSIMSLVNECTLKDITGGMLACFSLNSHITCQSSGPVELIWTKWV